MRRRIWPKTASMAPIEAQWIAEYDDCATAAVNLVPLEIGHVQAASKD